MVVTYVRMITREREEVMVKSRVCVCVCANKKNYVLSFKEGII